MTGGNRMIGPSSNGALCNVLLTIMLTAFFSHLVPSSPTRAQSSQSLATSPQPVQKLFATPKEAADALIQAAGNFDFLALKEILGPYGEALVTTEDSVQDKNRAAAFAAKAREKSSVTVDSQNSNRAEVVVGNDEWPLPIPIVKKNGKWFFDTKERGWKLGGTHRRRNCQGPRARLHEQRSTLSRLFFQDLEGTRSGRSTGPDGFRGERGDDRGFRSRRRAC